MIRRLNDERAGRIQTMNAIPTPPDGLLVVDKPAGWTSHDIVARVRRLTGERRVGHAGTLDPLATGVLVLGVGQGTRVLAYLGDASKAYRARVRLGVATDTYDAEGQVTAQTTTDGISAALVEAALAPFRGTFEQRPPIYSALKRAGRPLYSYARAGIQIEAPARPVHVETLRLLGFDPPDVDLEIACSSGFYVRGLAHDLGQRLACGAHLLALRRTRVGAFAVEQAATIEALERAAADGSLATTLRPLDAALRRLPALMLDSSQELAAVRGQQFKVMDGPKDGLILRQAEDEQCGIATHDAWDRSTAQAKQDSSPAHGELVEPRAAPSTVHDSRRSTSPDLIPEPGAVLCRAYAPDGSLTAILSLSADGFARPLRVFPSDRRGPRSPAIESVALQ